MVAECCWELSVDIVLNPLGVPSRMNVGQYATAMLFAARTLGYDVRLYDGSMQEWGGILQYPLDKRETAAKKA